MAKTFSFAALMSIVTMRNLATTLEEQYDLLRHLVGCGTVGGEPDGRMLYSRAQATLFEQFPVLGDGHMQFAMGELILMLDTETGRQQPKELILGWLSKQSVRLGMDMNSPIAVEGL